MVSFNSGKIEEMTVTEHRDVVETYVRTWHEPDAEKRRQKISALWAEDCSYYNASTEFRGRAGVTEAVTEAYQAFVAQGFVFTVRAVDVNHDVVRYQWVMTPDGGGEPAAVGTHVCTLDDHGLMVCDHQFVDVAVGGRPA